MGQRFCLIHAFTFLHRNPALEEVVLFVWTQTQRGVVMEGPWQRRCLKLAWDDTLFQHISTIGSGKREINSQGGHVLEKTWTNYTTSAIDFSRFLRWSDAQQTCAAEQKDLRHSNTTLCDEENHDLLTAISSLRVIAHHRKQTTGIHWIDFCDWNAIYIL